jgi:hypothetical protein
VLQSGNPPDPQTCLTERPRKMVGGFVFLLVKKGKRATKIERWRKVSNNKRRSCKKYDEYLNLRSKENVCSPSAKRFHPLPTPYHPPPSPTHQP